MECLRLVVRLCLCLCLCGCVFYAGRIIVFWKEKITSDFSPSLLLNGLLSLSNYASMHFEMCLCSFFIDKDVNLICVWWLAVEWTMWMRRSIADIRTTGGYAAKWKCVFQFIFSFRFCFMKRIWYTDACGWLQMKWHDVYFWDGRMHGRSIMVERFLFATKWCDDLSASFAEAADVWWSSGNH